MHWKDSLRPSLGSIDQMWVRVLIYLIHQLFRLNLEPDRALELPGECDIRGALPGLQHEFCALWNELVLWAQNSRPCSNPIRFLKVICHHYIALH